MAIVRWTPQALNKIFDEDFWPTLSNWPDFTQVPGGIDIYETDDEVIVKAQVPGVKEENVNVSLEGNVLTISAAESETEEEKQKKKTVYKSTRQTSFNYSTSLPRMVDSANAVAEVESGVVTVTIPKTEAEKPRKISVKKK